MRSAPRLVIVVLAAVVPAACGDDDEPLATDDGTTGPGGVALAEEYVSVEVSEGDDARPLVVGTTVTMRFDGDQLGASLGCNQLGALYQIDGDRLAVRTEERRVGKEGVSTCKSRWLASH